MHERVLKRLRERIRTRRYLMTLHAEEEMTADRLTVFDVEHVTLAGTIIERQWDSQTSEWKYVIKGPGLAGDDVVIVAKLGPTGRMVIITVYAMQSQ